MTCNTDKVNITRVVYTYNNNVSRTLFLNIFLLVEFISMARDQVPISAAKRNARITAFQVYKSKGAGEIAQKICQLMSQGAPGRGGALCDVKPRMASQWLWIGASLTIRRTIRSSHHFLLQKKPTLFQYTREIDLIYLLERNIKV